VAYDGVDGGNDDYYGVDLCIFLADSNGIVRYCLKKYFTKRKIIPLCTP
jgi:hypothetical protein